MNNELSCWQLDPDTTDSLWSILSCCMRRRDSLCSSQQWEAVSYKYAVADIRRILCYVVSGDLS